MSGIDPLHCILCGGKRFVSIFDYTEPDQYERAVGVNKSGYYRCWIQCQDCGFYASRYSRSQSKLDGLYSVLYRSSNSTWRAQDSRTLFRKITQLPFDESETKQRIKWVKDRIHSEFQKDSPLRAAPYHLLDIGGATGVFAYEFKDANWISHVIDPDESGIFLKTELGIDFICARYSEHRFRRTFDLISLVYVLEHINDPESFLIEAWSNLKKDGYIYIEIPDAIVFEDTDSSDDIFNSCHLWFFSEKTIRKILRKTGFEPVCIEQVKTVRGIQCLMVLARGQVQ